MNIMYLTFSFTVGGTEHLLVDICNTMVKRGHNIFLYIINNLYDDSMLELLDSRVNIVKENRKVKSGNRFATIRNVSHFIKKNKIDIVHCNSVRTPEILFFHKVFNRKTRVIYTIHDMNSYRRLNRLQVILRNIICTKIIAISKSVQEILIQCGASKKKTSVIYNAIDLNKFKEVSLKQFNIDKPTIGNVARIVPSIKGQDILIKAISILKVNYPNIKCIFAGTTNDENTLKELKELVVNLNLLDNIEFVGNINNVADFLQNIDIFVLPSRFEGFGISLLEALSVGVPCVASKIAGPAELLNNEENGVLFECGNEKDLAIKVTSILENYNYYKTKTISTMSSIRNNFNIENMCKQLEELYIT